MRRKKNIDTPTFKKQVEQQRKISTFGQALIYRLHTGLEMGLTITAFRPKETFSSAKTPALSPPQPPL